MAIVLVHAVAEITDVVGASRVLVLLLVGAALPQTVVHGLGGSGLLRLSGGTGATTGEETTDGVADGGTDSDTAARKLAVSPRKSSTPDFLGKMRRSLFGFYFSWTYAAVEAIWPKRPGPALCWGGACICWGGAAAVE